MNSVIKESIKKSISYTDYIEAVKQLTVIHSNSGIDKTEELAEFTKLNDKRMKRWGKTIKITEETKEKISNLNKKMTWLIITESWCGDAAHVMPVINKIAELNTNINLRVVFRDENLDLIDQFLTNGGRAIAKLIIINDDTDEVVNTYGPRPSEATNLVNEYKAKHGSLTPEFKEGLQHWYNKNKGQNVIDDMLIMLDSL